MPAWQFLFFLLTMLVVLAVWPAILDWCTRWDAWVGKSDDPEDMVMQIKHLVHIRRWGFRIDLHRFLQPDAVGCFHTHPALAFRVPLWNGYDEEVCVPLLTERSFGTYIKSWRPGRMGWIEPDFAHRIAALPRGPALSLWTRFRCTHDIHLVGPGWEKLKQTPRLYVKLPSDESFGKRGGL